ncbi:MAG: MFS transporter [Ideonella sp.]|nr:MFS transporter [Ideonella sp.]MCC7459321.1 MFS transporter [Nitrospira sp.]
MSSLSLVFSVCAFASGFGMRTLDPLILPIGDAFGVTPSTAALLTTAYALPYAVAQPFLGPLGDRFGKLRCIRICVAVMALALLAGALAPGFGSLLATRLVAGVFAGGIIPLVLAGLGDAYDLHERQVAVGRLLVAIISGQMLGSAASGLVSAALGWRGALGLSGAVAVCAVALSAWSLRAGSTTCAPQPAVAPQPFRALYAQVFANPLAPWLYGAVVCEGALVFCLFPYMGQLLLEHGGSSAAAAPSQAGLVLGGFGIGGIVYGLAVRRIIQVLGMRRMCALGATAVAGVYALLVWLPVWWLHLLAMAVSGIGYYMLHNCLQIESTELAPSARGSAVALFAGGFFLGQGLGPLLFGALMHAAGFGAALSAAALGLVVLGRVVVSRVVARQATAAAAH